MNVAQSIMQTNLPSIDSVYTSHCLGKAAIIIKDPTPPPQTFSLPPSSVGKKIQKSEVTYQPTQEKASSLLLSDFCMGLPCIKLIFLSTLAMTITLHSALSCFLLYEWYVLSAQRADKKQYFSLYVNTCDNNKSNQIKTPG